MCSADIFLGVLAILFPPLPVWVKRGICSADSLINILLCLLGVIPGLLHAWYIIAKFPEPPYEYESVGQDGENGRVRYVYVQGPAGSQQQQPRLQQHQGPNGGMNYGTNPSNGSAPGYQQPNTSNTAQGSNGIPPSYAEVVAGDHKVQSRE